jgi:hypothetical protein
MGCINDMDTRHAGRANTQAGQTQACNYGMQQALYIQMMQLQHDVKQMNAATYATRRVCLSPSSAHNVFSTRILASAVLIQLHELCRNHCAQPLLRIFILPYAHTIVQQVSQRYHNHTSAWPEAVAAAQQLHACSLEGRQAAALLCRADS